MSGFLLQYTCISGDFPETIRIRWNLKKGIRICVSVCSNCRSVKHCNLWASFLFILACDYKKMWVVTQQKMIKTCETKIQPPKKIVGPLKWRHFWGAFGFLRRKKEKNWTFSWFARSHRGWKLTTGTEGNKTKHCHLKKGSNVLLANASFSSLWKFPFWECGDVCIFQALRTLIHSILVARLEVWQNVWG